MLKFFRYLFIFLILSLVFGLAFLYFGTYRPKDIVHERVYNQEAAPTLQAGQRVKVLSWNIQYLAGKDFIFFYEDPENGVKRPTRAAIEKTREALVKTIIREDPDIILLQEVDDGAKRTDYEDQLAKILLLLPAHYTSHSSSFYWKAAYIPHSKIMGAAGMKLSVISKYKITSSIRHQLALIERANKSWADPFYNWLERQFYLKRAVQEVSIPMDNGRNLVVLNTHLSAFSQGTNTLEKQIKQVEALVTQNERKGIPWILGGDFNMLPPGQSFKRLDKSQSVAYREKSEIKGFYEKYPGFPSPQQVDGKNRSHWFTYFPNDVIIKGPDRTIDYMFYSPQIRLGPHVVLQKETWAISDHLPLVAYYYLPR